MAKVRTVLELYGVLLLVAALSSFTVIQADDESAKSSEKDTSVVDDSSSQENSKEKRSREEILFGNQQNKPNGLVDDLMSMAEDEATKEDSKGSDKNQEGKGNEISSKEENDEKREAPSDEERDMMASDSDSWYNTVPVSSTALQYLANAPALQSLPSQEFANTLYDQEDVYRRKRQLLGHPLPLRKRRSLRSSLGQMIQQRGLRMPRRSMRLKRQVDLYSLLGNDAFYEDQAQVPGHFISYQETPAPEYRYPFTFQHRDDGILNLGNEMEDNDENMEQGLTLEDLNDILTTHPKNQFPYSLPSSSSSTVNDSNANNTAVSVHQPNNYPETLRLRFRRFEQDRPESQSQDEEGKAMQEWLARYTVPNTFRVARRSAPAFYPLDYRYIPGYKKRSPIFRNSNRIPSRYPSNAEEVEPDLGTWGHVVQVPEAYASPEDVARLYGLASLMAEGDDEAKAKRSA